jgi:hypothetical protein
VRRAVSDICPRLDVPEGDSVLLVWRDEHRAGQFADRVGHVRRKLRTDISWQGGRVERHVVWATADVYIFDPIANLDGDFGRIIVVALLISNHPNRVDRPGDRSKAVSAAALSFVACFSPPPHAARAKTLAAATVNPKNRMKSKSPGEFDRYRDLYRYL